MWFNLGHKSWTGHRALRMGCAWGVGRPHHASAVAGTVFCPGTLLGHSLCPGWPHANASYGSGSRAEPTKWLSTSFLSLSLSVWAGVPCCPAIAMAGPVSGCWGSQEEMGHLLGESCFGLQWHTLIKQEENVKKGLGNGPKQTAVLRCPSDSGTMALCDTRVIPGVHQDNAHPRAWPEHEGQSGAQCDQAAFQPLKRGTRMGWQGRGERGFARLPGSGNHQCCYLQGCCSRKVTVCDNCQGLGLSMDSSDQVVCSLPSPHTSLRPSFLPCSHSYMPLAGQRSHHCSRHGDPAATCTALGPSQVPAGMGSTMTCTSWPHCGVGPHQLPLASSGHAFLPRTAGFRHRPPPRDIQPVPLRQ